jgi:hypothetical protein
VLDANAQGKLRFSATRGARVEEEQNFRDFSASSAAPAAEPAATPQAPKKAPVTSGFGSLGDLMREKFGAAPAPAAAKPATAKSSAPGKPQPSGGGHAQPERGDVIKRKR